MGVLIAANGSLSLPALLLVAGVPFLAIGHYHSSDQGFPSQYMILGKPIQLVLGIFLLCLGSTLACLASPSLGDRSGAENLKFEMLDPEEILIDLRCLADLEATRRGVRPTERGDGSVLTDAVKPGESLDLDRSLKSLSALSVKCGKEQKRQKKIPAKQKRHEGTDEDLLAQNTEGTWKGFRRYKAHEIETICQEAAYIVLGLHPNINEAVSAAISLLALVSGDTEVRRLHMEEADKFGLNVPVRAMRDALSRAKLFDVKKGRSPSEEEERLSAELQRKGCLLLGALADGNRDIATKVVDEDGLEAALDAVDWFRFHADVANWSLWAVFILCYDHPGNKGHLMRLGGIQRICRVMKDIPNSPEVARHAVAILFDLMREVPNNLTDLSQIRMIALNAGVHEVVRKAMDENPSSVEIMMMGQQMLVATGYKGDIPQYQPKR